MADLPINMTADGPQPTPPLQLWKTLLANVAATNPGYTANLPGSLIEDISSTDVAAVVLCDSAMVELVNSISPFGANAFLLQQLGEVYGVKPNAASNTSVYVVFTSPDIGFLIAQGFTVTDGVYEYVVQDGGIIGAGGTSLPLYCVATEAGSWAVPSGTVQGLITSIPSTIILACNNPTTGTPGGDAETETAFRSRVLQAGLAASQGMPRYLRTLLNNVPGVIPRLVSPVQIPGQGWEVIIGGGDPYQVAYAIFSALFDVATLQGSQMLISNITQANPGVVTTVLNHGYAAGQVINIQGVLGMVAVNNVALTVTPITATTFSIGINTSGYAAYTSGGVCTPNLRNVSVNVLDYPDTYGITFVNPPQQTVAVTALWNTPSFNYVNPVTISQLATPALVNYLNSIVVGQPINIFAMNDAFQEAVASVLSKDLLTRLVFQVSINGIGVSPTAGTGIIPGDPESYFLTNSGLVTVLQG